MSFHHGGGGGGMMQVDFGFCSVHQRRRQKHDLIEDPDVPGKLRCTDRRACRPVMQQAGGHFGGRNDVHDDANWCTCRLHGRRRNVSHMREVAPGEFECVAPYLCHSGPNPNQVMRHQNFAATEGGDGAPPQHHGGYNHMPRYDNEHHPLQRQEQQQQYLQQQQQQYHQTQQHQTQENAPAPVWVPNVPSAPAHGAHGGASSANSYFAPQHQQTARGAPPMYPGGHEAAQQPYNVDVWCARHGKHVSMYMCDVIDDVVYVCRDGQHCLAGPLEAPAALAAQPGSEEVLCSRHATLRRLSFLALSTDGQGYECIMGKHPCRSTDTHMIGQLSAPVDERADVQQGGDGLGGGWGADGGGGGAWGGGHSGQSYQTGSAQQTASAFFA